MVILIIISISSMVFSIKNKFEMKKQKEALTIQIKNNLESFASRARNGLSNEKLYAEQYAHIAVAKELMNQLNLGKTYPSEEYTYSLSNLLQQFEIIMIEDKNRVEKIINSEEVSKLIFDIALNFENKEAIKRLLDLLGE